jgi:Cu/Ag efflux protein CusF
MQRMTSVVSRRAIVCVATALLLAGCAKPQPVKTYQMSGEVMGIDAAGHVATIKHGDIPGFMSAMTMGYPVKDQAELSKLTVGEKIAATLYKNGDDDFWIGNIRKADK